MAPSPEAHSGRLILVSNRLPVVLEEGDAGWQSRLAAGGLATGLSGPHRRSGGKWIGWPGVATPGGELPAEVKEVLGQQAMVGVGLSEEEHERYYTRISNRCLWPLFHYFAERMVFDPQDWATYEAVNRRFADAVLAEHRPGDVVFVQDFHLTLLPAMLRAEIPELPIGFFLHIPFPSSEIFRIFARREQVLEGLLGADVLGFHTLSYVRHFRTAASHLLGIETRGNQLRYNGRRVRLLARPLGIDPTDWEGGDEDTAVIEEMEQLRTALAGRKLLLGVERLDYTKGVPERLRAFGDMLAQDPALVEKVMFIQIAVPSRVEVEEYRDLKDEVDRLAGAINSEHSRPGLQALHYQFRGVPPAMLRALYRLADVCVVTPLRDGLNLVAKEFVASREDDEGVLVLGENTGAAWELGEALRVNPYDPAAMVAVFRRALSMPAEERRPRMQAMRRRVAEADVHVWAEQMIGAIRHADSHGPAAVAGRSEPGRAAAGLAGGGPPHLVPRLRRHPARIHRPAGGRAAQRRAARPAGRAGGDARGGALGRQRPPRAPLLAEWLGETGVGLVAEHGASVRPPGELEFLSLTDELPLDWRPEVEEILQEFASRVPRSRVERKPLGLAWHYREAKPEQRAWQGARALPPPRGDPSPTGRWRSCAATWSSRCARPGSARAAPRWA